MSYGKGTKNTGRYKGTLKWSVRTFLLLNTVSSVKDLHDEAAGQRIPIYLSVGFR